MGNISQKTIKAGLKKEHYHFIGIGGIGMGSLASLLLAKGYKVSGSDLKENPMVKSLREHGAEIMIGHDLNNVIGAETVIYSSAISHDNPEIIAARNSHLPCWQRAQLLSNLMVDHVAITVAGAHGKTTTSSMIANLLLKADLKPTTAIGGIVQGTSNNAVLGDGKYFVAELDESDGSFLYFHPQYSIITNIDFEHVDYYRNWNKITVAFQKFINQTDSNGKIIVWGEDKRLMELVKNSDRSFITYGLTPENDVYAKNIRQLSLADSTECGCEFECYFKDKLAGIVKLPIPGRHNVLNALACLALGQQLSIEFCVMKDGLKTFRGVNRRFQIVGEIEGITVADDYGHHPTEISATLQAARSLKKERVITIFQPHRYSRTKHLFEEFVRCLSTADELFITDIYAANEEPLKGVTAAKLCEEIKKSGKADVQYLKKEDILYHLLKIVKPGDLVLTLGAGDISQIAGDLMYFLRDKYRKHRISDLKRVNRTNLKKRFGHIGVLMGGNSSEREISLKSGKAVLKALKESGCNVTPIDIKSTDEMQVTEILNKNKINIAFIAMHGEFGEDGTLQEILENEQICYTGSDAMASRISINKVLCQSLLNDNGVNVPDYQIITEGQRISTKEILSALDLPVIVKPASQGSSIGITIVNKETNLNRAMDFAFQYDHEVIIEKYIYGREITAGIIDGKALPLIEIRPRSTFFDFTAKYQDGITDYIVPARLNIAETKRLQQAALYAFQILGLRDFARMDFIFDDLGQPYFLEVNNIPGFTSSSLLPMAAHEAGFSFSDLCLKILQLAERRTTKRRVKVKV